jgi:hypothetical protein
MTQISFMPKSATTKRPFKKSWPIHADTPTFSIQAEYRRDCKYFEARADRLVELLVQSYPNATIDHVQNARQDSFELTLVHPDKGKHVIWTAVDIPRGKPKIPKQQVTLDKLSALLL